MKAPRDDFYRAFEDRFRGSRELIRSRLTVYLPFIEPLKSVYGEPAAVDLGCGRGEWLELLAENGFDARGVDLDEGMLAACRERGLPATQGDAIAFLQELPDESQAIVSGFHIAEHLPFAQLQLLVREALRVLKPAGLLILETPNPENFSVSSLTFHLDPTHRNPLPPALLSFLPEHYGFARVKVLRLAEQPELRDSDTASLGQVLGGVSPDYAVIAQKAAAKAQLFDSAFNKEFGLDPHVLIERFDRQLQAQSALAIDLETLRSQQHDLLAQQGAAQAHAAAMAQHLNQMSHELQLLRIVVEKRGLKRHLKRIERSIRKRRDRMRERLKKVERSIRKGRDRFLASRLGSWLKHFEVPRQSETDVEANLWREPWDVRLAYRRLCAARDDLRQATRQEWLPRRRLRLAYVSPLPPQKTGVADYSAELIPALAAHYEVDAVVAVPPDNIEPIRGLRAIHDMAWFELHAHAYDRIIYHVGNSLFHHEMFPLIERYPGVVVLHDFYLGHLFGKLELEGRWKGCWMKALYHAHGYPAVRRRFEPGSLADVVRDYPANLFIIEQAQGIIVHSNFSRSLARRFYGDAFSDDWIVIPHLRKLPENVDRTAARTALGLKETDFLVCSFGVLGEYKLNHRLLECWLASRLKEQSHCHLLFIGEAPASEYCDNLRAVIDQSPAKENIRIAGFASPEIYRRYLAAADAAVQLRCHSRGESSGTVLDCMAYSVPLVTNAHGSAAELPDHGIIKIPDDFGNNDLVRALESLETDPDHRRALGERARRIIVEAFSPASAAARYRDAIERFASAAPPLFNMRALSQAARQRPRARADGMAWIKKARALVEQSQRKRSRQLLIDISALVREDLRIGIQRVARAQLMSLLAEPLDGFRVEPVWFHEAKGQLHYRYARRYTSSLLGISGADLDDDPVSVAPGDIYYMPHQFNGGIVRAASTGLYACWRSRGLSLNFMVYDYLPLTRPEFFPDGTGKLYADWLHAVAAAGDRLICISHDVAEGVMRWLKTNEPERSSNPEIAVLHLGADLDTSAATKGLPETAPAVLEAVASRPTFLMVGTIEPRKGYLQTLAAFDLLWRDGVDTNLVIVGAEGWKPIPEGQRRTLLQIVACLQDHPQLGHRLFWLEDVSDEYLEQLYRGAACLIAASEGEGFGLPLVEAARHKLPILARDIPVFREVADNHAAYFKGLEAADLAAAIKHWLGLCAKGEHPRSDDMPWMNWKENVKRLQRILGLPLNPSDACA